MSVTPEFGFPLPSDQSRIVKFPSHLRTLSTTLEDKLPAAVTSAARAEVPAVVERYAADLRKSVDDAVARLDSFKGNGVETVFGTVTLDATGEPIREFYTTGATTFYANGATTPVAAHTAVVWRRTGVGSWGYQEVPDEWTTPTPTPDTTAPVAGTLAVSAADVTADLTVTGASDDRGYVQYSFSKDNGANWTAYQDPATYTFTGLSTSTPYTFKHRVRDAAGNVTTGAAVSATTTEPSVTLPLTETFETAGTLAGKQTTTGGGTWRTGTNTEFSTSVDIGGSLVAEAGVGKAPGHALVTLGKAATRAEVDYVIRSGNFRIAVASGGDSNQCFQLIPGGTTSAPWQDRVRVGVGGQLANFPASGHLVVTLDGATITATVGSVSLTAHLPKTPTGTVWGIQCAGDADFDNWAVYA